MYTSIVRTKQQLLSLKFYQIFHSKSTPHTSTWRRAVGCLSGVIRRKMPMIYRERTVLNIAKEPEKLCWPNNFLIRVEMVDRGGLSFDRHIINVYPCNTGPRFIWCRIDGNQIYFTDQFSRQKRTDSDSSEFFFWNSTLKFQQTY